MARRSILLSIIFCLNLSSVSGQETGAISGTVYGRSLDQRLENIAVIIENTDRRTYTDKDGHYEFLNIPEGEYLLIFRQLGYEPYRVKIHLQKGEARSLSVRLKENALQLSDVEVTKRRDPNAGDVFSRIDMQLRPANSSQDLLQLVPGLFIAQHAGGGKAEQIFLRGFDVDHGTDFAISVDGIPVNMVSHAHGQGYADMHFVIPETIEELQVFKGTYTARFGDLATAGAGEFKTANALDKSQLKLEYGQFNTIRGLAMVDLLKNRQLISKHKESAYIAAEYKFADAYFISPQNFNRFNILGKYHGLLSDKLSMTLTLSSFHSSWDASGQIPQRKVDDGTISRFGSIDNSEGGQTSRSNVNLKFSKALPGNASLTNQFYYSRYHFDLYSNFTFFLNDSINGDGIRQKDDRNLFGYSGTYSVQGKLFGKNLQSLYGIGARYDAAGLELSRAVNRIIIDTTVRGQLNQLNTFAYTEQTLNLSSKWRLNAGLRADLYNFRFCDHLYDTASGNANKGRVSPKLNLFYNPAKNIEVFVKSGYGFHSNDARAVVVAGHENALPRALGYETGITSRIFKNTLVNIAFWALDLENELVYVGDEGIVEISGRTRRRGIDVGIRHQFTKHLYADLDISYNKGWLRDEAEGANHIPLAPWFTSTGGLSYKPKSTGFSGSIRYRYMADRPANESNTVTAQGFFLVDAVLQYSWTKFQLSLSVENLLNAQWNEAQFDTESRLRGEPAPVSELHFTPGTPLFVKGSVGYCF